MSQDQGIACERPGVTNVRSPAMAMTLIPFNPLYLARSVLEEYVFDLLVLVLPYALYEKAEGIHIRARVVDLSPVHEGEHVEDQEPEERHEHAQKYRRLV